jgi:hypothetical protein
MQTFLPYQDFLRSAKVLDRQRLGKQRVEVLQLLRAISDGGAWSNHPAAKMWRCNTNALVLYGLIMCNEWQTRGYLDTCYDKISEHTTPGIGCVMPSWLGDEAFHASHRSNLLRKDPSHYGKFGWSEPPDLPYIWPQP